MSARELGRRLRPDMPEYGRRMVVSYLSPTEQVLPRKKRRRELAHALGLPDDAFDEQEAASPMVAELMERIRPVLNEYARELERVSTGGRNDERG